jgi:hypothetical protein
MILPMSMGNLKAPLKSWATGGGPGCGWAVAWRSASATLRRLMVAARFLAASPGPKPTSPRVIQRTLETVRRTATTKVTAFTDGCPGLCTARQLCQTIPCLETGLVHRPEAR